MLQFFKLIQVQNIFYSKKAKKKISRKTKKTKVTDSSGSESESEEEEAMWLEKTGRERERERERERDLERERFSITFPYVCLQVKQRVLNIFFLECVLLFVTINVNGTCFLICTNF